MELKRYGTEYGGYYLPKDLVLKGPDTIVYSVGIGEDISFDLEIAKKLKCNVYMFDPTQRAIDHVTLIKSGANLEQNVRYGGGDKKYPDIVRLHRDCFKFLNVHNYGVHTYTGTCSFYEPENPRFVSYTTEIAMRTKATKSITIPVKSLPDIMKSKGHNHIDILKIDIEGIECEVLLDLLSRGVFPTYVCVDFDARRKGIKMDLYDQVTTELLKHYEILDFRSSFDVTWGRLTSESEVSPRTA